MVEQIKSLDYLERGVRLIEPAPPEFLDDVLEMLDACLR